MDKFVAKEFHWQATQTDTEFEFPMLADLLVKYQNPTAADSLMKLQKDIDSTKDIVIRTIDQLLDRGEKLETLAAKSDDLCFQSRVFVEKSSEMNSCCVIL
jgi:synaptobrevin family protein YKT6